MGLVENSFHSQIAKKTNDIEMKTNDVASRYIDDFFEITYISNSLLRVYISRVYTSAFNDPNRTITLTSGSSQKAVDFLY